MSNSVIHSPENHKRKRLPNRRASEIIAFERDGLQFQLTVGFYGDSTPGEVFFNAAPHNSALDILVADAAIIVSLALQHGCDLDTIRHALRRDVRGNAASPIGFALDQIGGGK